jgi:hypothetical protein
VVFPLADTRYRFGFYKCLRNSPSPYHRLEGKRADLESNKVLLEACQLHLVMEVVAAAVEIGEKVSEAVLRARSELGHDLDTAAYRESLKTRNLRMRDQFSSFMEQVKQQNAQHDVD